MSPEKEFGSQNSLIWSALGTYTGILVVLLLVGLLLVVWVRSLLAMLYVFYVSVSLFYQLQALGVGPMWIPFWPGGDSFRLMQTIAVALVIAGIGVLIIGFLRLKGILLYAIGGGLAVTSLTFLSAYWIPSLYKLGALFIIPLALLAITVLLLSMRQGDKAISWFAAGLVAALFGGGVQAASILSGGAGVTGVASFAFAIGNLIESGFWLLALGTRLREDHLHLQARLVFDAEHDELTKLPNRVFLRRRLESCIEAAHRDSETLFGLIFLDIDRFKVINDSLGHAVGDRLLQEVSHIITEIIKGTGIVARFGGDEFLILIEEPCTQQSASELASKLTRTLAKPITIDDLELRVNASAGLVMVTGNYDFVDSVIRDADTALQVAKQEHRGNYVAFDQEMRKKIDHRFNIEQEIQHGLEEDEFSMVFQPIMSIKENSHVGFEALVRWQNAKYGFIRPDEFIPVAEDTGTIRELGKVILLKSISAIGRWKKQGLWQDGWYVSINVSGEQLYDSSLTQLIEESLFVYNVAPQDIRLELTETSVIANQNAADDVLPNLRDQGIKLCMDDFGTGYSSLSYLKVLPFDVIKIDKSFIDEIESEAQSRKLVSTVLTLAADLNFLVVAEGIETDQQQQILAEMNCRFGQGYLYSKPMEEKDATEWLRRYCDESGTD